jgi:hypothetical protein
MSNHMPTFSIYCSSKNGSEQLQWQTDLHRFEELQVIFNLIGD